MQSCQKLVLQMCCGRSAPHSLKATQCCFFAILYCIAVVASQIPCTCMLFRSEQHWLIVADNAWKAAPLGLTSVSRTPCQGMASATQAAMSAAGLQGRADVNGTPTGLSSRNIACQYFHSFRRLQGPAAATHTSSCESISGTEALLAVLHIEGTCS